MQAWSRPEFQLQLETHMVRIACVPIRCIIDNVTIGKATHDGLCKHLCASFLSRGAQ